MRAVSGQMLAHRTQSQNIREGVEPPQATDLALFFELRNIILMLVQKMLDLLLVDLDLDLVPLLKLLHLPILVPKLCFAIFQLLCTLDPLQGRVRTRGSHSVSDRDPSQTFFVISQNVLTLSRSN